MATAATPIVVEGAPAQVYTANKDHTKMGYDPDTTLPIMEEIKKISDKIQKDVDTIGTRFGTLKTKYDTFSDFDDYMDKATSNLNASAEKIAQCVTQIMEVLATNLNELVQQDDSLKDDIAALNNLIANGELPETFGYGN